MVRREHVHVRHRPGGGPPVEVADRAHVRVLEGVPGDEGAGLDLVQAIPKNIGGISGNIGGSGKLRRAVRNRDVELPFVFPLDRSRYLEVVIQAAPPVVPVDLLRGFQVTRDDVTVARACRSGGRR